MFNHLKNLIKVQIPAVLPYQPEFSFDLALPKAYMSYICAPLICVLKPVWNRAVSETQKTPISGMSQTLLEKLQLADEKNLLIQGLPSSIEKQFSKLSFAKNVTPLLKTRKIDFALVFAVNENQLNSILQEVMPALKNDSKFWVAFPKTTSKIVTDLNRECSWNKLTAAGYECLEQVALDHVWSATRYCKGSLVEGIRISRRELAAVEA